MQDIAPGNDQVRRRFGHLRLFHQAAHFGQRALALARRDDAIAGNFILRDFQHRDQVAADRVVGIDHLLHAARGTDHQFVRQEDGERLVPDDGPRAPDGMAQAVGHLLAHGHKVARGQPGRLQHVEQVLLAFQRAFQLIGRVEMVDQRRLAAPGDEDHLLDPRLARFVHGILDQRPVDHRHHFLGDGLGGGQEAGAAPGNGKHGLADRLVSAHGRGKSQAHGPRSMVRACRDGESR